MFMTESSNARIFSGIAQTREYQTHHSAIVSFYAEKWGDLIGKRLQSLALEMFAIGKSRAVRHPEEKRKDGQGARVNRVRNVP